jgi:colanic acid/amylovoran biosynthesis glycosyltransferase
LLHIYFGHIAVHLLPLIHAWKKPSLVSFHGADVLVEMEKPAYRRATEEMLSAVSRVLVRSESLRRALLELGCEPSKLDIVRTGIPLGDFRYRARTGPPNGEWKVLQACRLIEKKGLPVTFQAFARFVTRHARASLTIAGEGPMLAELQELATQLGIREKVTFPGLVTQDELRALYYNAHLFLHPSQTGRDGNQEGVPNSMLEAMATGLPVFATRHGGIPEAVENGVSGVLVGEGDADALAQAMQHAVEDSVQLFAMGERGSKSVKQNFDQAQQVQRLEEIYLQTMV